MRVRNMLRKLPSHLRFFRPHGSTESESAAAQYLDMVVLLWKYRLTPKEYHFYRFFERDRTRHEARGFLSTWRYHKYFLKKVNDRRWIDIAEDKYIFDFLLRDRVRLPRFLGFLHHHRFGHDFRSRPLRNVTELASGQHLDRFVSWRRYGKEHSNCCS